MPQTDPTPATDAAEGRPPLYRVKVWDLPTRLFHWLIVVLVGSSFVTADIGGAAMEYHEACGVIILVLVFFRVVWGFCGGQQARFSAFVRAPGAVREYTAGLLKGSSPRHLGHNPLGGWSVLLMLAALLIQAGTGLFANDDILFEGPLSGTVTKHASDILTGVHLVNRAILAGLIAIHIGAVVFHLVFKKDNLIFPMVSGKKAWHRQADASGGPLWLAVAIAAALAIAVYALFY